MNTQTVTYTPAETPTSFRLKLSLSDAARADYAVQTGRVTRGVQELTVDLRSFTAEERVAFLSRVGLPQWADTAVEFAERIEPPGGETAAAPVPAYFDADVVPTTAAEWLALVDARDDWRAQRLAYVESVRAERAQQQAAAIVDSERQVTEYEGLDDEALLARYDRVRLAAGRRNGLGIDLPIGRPDALAVRSLAVARRATALYDAREQEADNAREAKARAIAEAQGEEKRAWIDTHGSDHLRKACQAGYDCTRLYVDERAAIELPGFEVLIGKRADRADWSSRSCPSEPALDLALRYQDRDAGVVWLTDAGVRGEHGDTEFEPCEAVVIRGYLGKYDAVHLPPLAEGAEGAAE